MIELHAQPRIERQLAALVDQPLGERERERGLGPDLFRGLRQCRIGLRVRPAGADRLDGMGGEERLELGPVARGRRALGPRPPLAQIAWIASSSASYGTTSSTRPIAAASSAADRVPV